ncbi:RNA methyltransferase [Fulvivirgaceae bacterium BMA10]|uniref:tRNA (guanosine(18)-2'-O)-methyltransferase n=1 Tax=Splendidivirga corallicola TaxID=3051826 RepID=A0ABT8KS71_9BACT|nr:RNA methyltransferase [Fulvivirgaceae bacterium BMA10]
MDNQLQNELIDFLGDYVTDHKKELIQEILANRTRYITVALEDIYQPQNASAVVRTCDCFGIQDIHIIENSNKYDLNPKVVQGASKWVDLIKYDCEGADNTKACIEDLRRKGYKIIATSPRKPSTSIHDLNLDQKIALMFGTELTGLSDDALSAADELVHIPMYGFTESFNLSVSAAICMSILSHQLRRSNVNWRLNEEEKATLQLKWFRKIVNKSEMLEAKFLENRDK